jgi:hypothetical protein
MLAPSDEAVTLCYCSYCATYPLLECCEAAAAHQRTALCIHAAKLHMQVGCFAAKRSPPERKLVC